MTLAELRALDAVHGVDRLRGHAFVPDDDELSRVPELYATESTDVDDKVVYLHYFAAAADWWLVEIEHDSTLAFGYCSLGDPSLAEWGYVDLAELAVVVVTGGVAERGGVTHLRPTIVVERDLHWQPLPWREVKR